MECRELERLIHSFSMAPAPCILLTQCEYKKLVEQYKKCFNASTNALSQPTFQAAKAHTP